MSGWLIGIALVALATIAAVGIRKLRAQVLDLQGRLAILEERFSVLQRQSQSDILDIGQRVLDADRQLRALDERIDAIASSEPAGEVSYGQLETLLSQSVEQQGEAPAAELELLSLLRQQQRP